jgi:hypothetical protein
MGSVAEHGGLKASLLDANLLASDAKLKRRCISVTRKGLSSVTMINPCQHTLANTTMTAKPRGI